MMQPLNYFLKYQMDWLNDNAQVKVWEKSRRIGATYVQSFEDVRDCVHGRVPAVWFSSADESAAREYILYCAQWAEMYQAAAKDMGETVVEKQQDLKAMRIKFSNGARINALSSSPKAFRSKGGKVVLDEFAHHEDQLEMWKAAKPSATWGFPIRILSTHNGKQSLFYKFTERIKSKELGWNLHTTDIFSAVNDGLVDKIYKRQTTEQERAGWLKRVEEDAFDKSTWLEEYCCVPVDESTAFISYDMIEGVENDSLNSALLNDELQNISGQLYLGMDIGRKKDLTVIWVLEEIYGVLFTRLVKSMQGENFKTQKDVLFKLLSHANLRRACLDATGLGMQLAEEAQDAFGKFKVEPVMFTGRTKEELAYNLFTRMESKTIFIPADNAIREDLHSVRKITTSANNIRFDADRSEIAGHADRFWALALAAHAAANAVNAPVVIQSAGRKNSLSILDKY
ncbi:MAG TPA: terminase family protein [Ignavibacteriales bacterium]|nr:terminase family protein [Ignavibacteriales bacterium]